MKFILGILGYLGIGFVWMLLAIVACKKFKLRLFWGQDYIGRWRRNYLELLFLIGWPLLVPVGVLIWLLYLIQRVYAPIIGREPPEDGWGVE
jgi:hypothetical protein